MDMNGLLQLLVSLIILAIVFYAVVWLIDWVAPPPPLLMPIKAIVALILVLYLLSILTGYAPAPTHFFWRK